jgi:hypothetical protein
MIQRFILISVYIFGSFFLLFTNSLFFGVNGFQEQNGCQFFTNKSCLNFMDESPSFRFSLVNVSAFYFQTHFLTISEIKPSRNTVESEEITSIDLDRVPFRKKSSVTFAKDGTKIIHITLKAVLTNGAHISVTALMFENSTVAHFHEGSRNFSKPSKPSNRSIELDQGSVFVALNISNWPFEHLSNHLALSLRIKTLSSGLDLSYTHLFNDSITLVRVPHMLAYLHHKLLHDDKDLTPSARYKVLHAFSPLELEFKIFIPAFQNYVYYDAWIQPDSHRSSSQLQMIYFVIGSLLGFAMLSILLTLVFVVRRYYHSLDDNPLVLEGVRTSTTNNGKNFNLIVSVFINYILFFFFSHHLISSFLLYFFVCLFV